MSVPIALLNSVCTHGARIITGSPDRYVNGQPVARLNDLVFCPQKDHGINPIIAVHVTQQTDNKPVAHVSAVTACGAMIITGSSDCYVG